jgi:uncharacterized membrane protein (UPF0127 family)
VTRQVLAVLAVVGLVGCSGSTGVPAADSPATASPSSPLASPSAAPAPTVRARLGELALALEVADEPGERARGLMGRTEVPPGTGMLFRFGQPVVSSFYMYRVPVPLHAAFLLDGRVVFTVVMPPCEQDEPQDCPTYGPTTPFDTVVETSPETARDVRVGDVLTLDGD